MNGTILQTRRCAVAPFSMAPFCILAALVVMAGLPQLAHGAQGFQGSEQTATANQAGAAHLYFFTNPGCAPCRQVEPGIHALAAEGYPVTTIMLNEHPDWGTRFSVDRTPTVILVANGKIAGRHAGLIDGVTLKKWFAAVGVKAGSKFAGQAGGTKVSLLPTSSLAASPAVALPLASPVNRNLPGAAGKSNADFRPATLHNGTTRPASENEARALAATVRLKVEDPEGISYATGTVIHYHNGECLVMTCGHVFRDADGKGAITAEFGFADGRVQSAAGQLIAYDADARDIALVAVNTNTPIEAVAIADKRSTVDKGLTVFSIGCDGGDQPTIRHSRIKNRAAYDGAIKYDIFGRPVSGRSGGGLFNSDGELIGVCNAAAVEVDEGIYTALETVHWQIANVNLQHLFDDAAVKQSLAADSHLRRGRNRGLSSSAPATVRHRYSRPVEPVRVLGYSIARVTGNCAQSPSGRHSTWTGRAPPAGIFQQSQAPVD
jgi:thiol-disulfide isomerase/thioredoxin